MTDDTAALLGELGVGQADIFGYSVGAAIALQLAMRYPELVRNLVLAMPVINAAGQHPGLREGMEFLSAEAIAGSPFAEAYARVAPNSDDWPILIEKIKQLSPETEDLSSADAEAIAAPVLFISGIPTSSARSTGSRSSGSSVVACPHPNSPCSPVPRTSR